MKLTIQNLLRQKFTVDIDPTCTVKDLKAKIKETQKVSKMFQTLHYGDVILGGEDDSDLGKTLEEYNLSDGDEIVLNTNFRGAINITHRFRVKNWPELNEYLKNFDGDIIQLDMSFNIKTMYGMHFDLANLQKLETLVLIHTYLTDLPDEFATLPNLTKIDLGANSIKQLPNIAKKCKTLTEFRCSNNQIADVSDIGELSPSIQKLDLNKNMIEELPSDIGKLTNLKWLDLGTNKISRVPDEIGNLTKLEFLCLVNNQLESLPDNICKLVQLDTLMIYYNRLKSLPDNICKLTKITSLNFSGNPIATLPDNIEQLLSLEHLKYQDTKISDIPDSLKL
uniref:Ubiquitin-like domain-containing protein n=1 Tax=viral metagenome TaxID=1070528 RepID=A0A6C0CK92_9ZZZZ